MVSVRHGIDRGNVAGSVKVGSAGAVAGEFFVFVFLWN